MILIEAARITSGGGLGLLTLLLEYLVKKSINFKVITGKEISFDFLPVDQVHQVHINIFNRKKILSDYVDKYKPGSLFCFGNFPPPARFPNVKTFTYFHRVGLLEQHSYGLATILRRVKYWAKSAYLKRLLNNGDVIFCQSEGVKKAFQNYFGYPSDKIELFPFYDEEKIKAHCAVSFIAGEPNSFIYVSNDSLHKNHIKLLESWSVLASEGFTPKLYLTVDQGSTLVETIESARSQGCDIINLGVLPYAEILGRLNSCEFAIYPSLQESLGLGLVEAAYANLKIVAADLPYVYEVVNPSLVFDPISSSSISKAVRDACTNPDLPKTTLKIKNKLPELVARITP